MNRLGLKVACLVAAIVIWMQVASTATVEQTARLPLRISGLEAGCTVTGSGLPPSVTVRLRGSKLRLLAHRYLSHPLGEVRVDLSDRAPGRPFTVALDNGNVASDLDVVDIVEPDRLTIRIDGQLTRRLPIALSLVGALPAGSGYLQRPVAVPDSVSVTGPARYFPERLSVRTAPLDLARLSGSGAVTLRVLPPDVHLQLSVHEVRVRYAVGLLAERTLADVPVLVAPEGALPDVEVAVSPPRADVMVRAVADSLRGLDPARLRVSVAAAGLGPGVHLVPGQVEGPEWLTVIGVEPAQFQVIVDAARGGGAAAGGGSGD